MTTAPGEDRVVVEAVLRAGAARQILVLHRTLDGEVVRGEPGAAVLLRGPGGVERWLTETALPVCAELPAAEAVDSLRIEASCYVTPPRSLDVLPGETYELEIVTRDGREIRGRTTVPGTFGFHGLDHLTGGACALAPGEQLPLAWSVARGAWSYLAGMRIERLREALAGSGIDAPERLELTGVAVSERDTTLVVPAEIGVFELGDVDQAILRLLQDGFPEGVYVALTVAAVDRNYVNAVRGGGFNPSGNVRIASVVGDGVGVFGSLVARDLVVRVGTGLPVPPCRAG